MTNERLTDILAEKVLGWRSAPTRFLTGDRGWLPRWRFQPLTNLEDAFRLLEKAARTFTLTGTDEGTFTAKVRVGNNRSGRASGKSKAAVISTAVARAIGLDVPDRLDSEER